MTNYTVDAIKTMVAKDHLISQELLSLLKNETHLIQARDYPSLKEVLLAKVPLLDQLQKHADLRKQWLLSLHKVADNAHWCNFLQSFNVPGINEQWEAVNKNIEACKAINQTNGVLITRGQKTHATLLHMLKGNTTNDTLYTATGNKQATNTYTTVAKA